VVASSEPLAAAVFVKIARVFISAPGDENGFFAWAFLDDGSKRTYIRSDLAKALNIEPESRCVFSTGSFGEHIRTLDSSLITIEVQGVHGHSAPVKIQAWTTEKLCAPITQEYLKTLPPAYRDLGPWADQYDGTERIVSLLIGSDFIWDCCSGEIVRTPGHPAAVSTAFGYVLSGISASSYSRFPGDQSLFPSPVHFVTDFDVHPFWELESIGIRDEPLPASSDVIPEFIPELGRYQIKLPFVDHRRPICNFQSAQAQLTRLRQKLSPQQMDEYNDGITTLLEKKVAEISPSSSATGYFMPHRGVWKKRLRIVFNASSPDVAGNSLNTCLDPGPNLLALLVDLLFRFRFKMYPVLADIEAAFHTILVHPDDRMYLKFLWQFDTGYSILQFCRVPFGINSGPHLLHATVQHHVRHFLDFGEDFCRTVLDSFYCDNLINSFDSSPQSMEFLQQATTCLRQAGMILKPTPMDGPMKVLGVSFCPQSDCISVNTSVLKVPPYFSRRELLRSLSLLFDPLGLASAWTIRPRLLLQAAWKSGRAWDEEVEADIRDAWISWLKEAGPPYSIPRCVNLRNSSELHVFCDSSSAAYAFIAYLVNPETGSGFLFSKARVAPLKTTLSIPRLELLAALIGCRFAFHFKTLIAPSTVRVVLWTDSQTVLTWIRKGQTKKDIFVANRLQEIAQKSEPDQWRYVPTYLNPADIPSRGCSLQELQSSKLYRSGPPFLLEAETQWPRLPAPSISFISIEVPSPPEIQHVLDPESTSSYTRLVRVHGWITRFVANLKALVNRDPPVRGPLRGIELNSALSHLIRVEQLKHYSSDLMQLKEKGQVSATSSLVPLHPRLGSSGLIEAVPRTGGPALPILSASSHLTVLFVRYIHESLFHMGAEATLAEVRRHVWIPRGRSLIKRLVFACIPCRRFKAPAFASSESQLMPFRVTPSVPFHRTGADFFGPLYVSDRKFWVLLLTCATTRAIHLELVDNGGSAACHSAFRRFLARRIRPLQTIEVWTDNAKTFLRMSSMRFPNNVLQWKTIPERSAWWGGWWERLIRTVKLSLKITLRHLRLDARELETILFEIESVVNTRPLTHVSSDVDDLAPLCPADFILGNSSDYRELLDPAAIPESTIRKLAVIRNETIGRFWKRWAHEYLASLQLWRRKTASPLQVQLGQVVLVKENTPRGTWALAKIVELIPGRDGVSRAVWLLLKGRRTRRAVDLLVPVESDYAFPIPSNRGGVENLRSPSRDTDASPSTDTTMEPPRLPGPARTRRGSNISNARGRHPRQNGRLVSSNLTTRSGRTVRQPDRY
jgi:hypothetical protein